MKTPKEVPQTLLAAVNYFSDPSVALGFLVWLRWPDGVVCPHCSSREVAFMEKRRVWQCRIKPCRKQFSAKVGTIFEDSPIALEKWLPCVWLIANAKNGSSSYEVGRALGVTQKTAWFMLHRIRLAMQTPTFGQFGGSVEVDETYIGGAARFMHKAKKERVIYGGRSGYRNASVSKVAVQGLLQRHHRGHSTVRATVVDDVRKQRLQANVRANVRAGAAVYTDALKSYDGLEADYIHGVIDHSEKYVDGQIHTNGLENFWSLLKRALKGTYVSVEPFHLFRYLDEEVFRFNNRKDNDAGRFESVLSSTIGKRVTYRALTGADLAETC
jgi:transposase-like protein